MAGRAIPAVLSGLAITFSSIVACAHGEVRFGSEGSGAGQFIEPQGIAVEQETGALYIVDANNYRVEKFAGNGAFLSAWGWGVANPKSATLQACTTRCYPGQWGAGDGQLKFAEGLAVDNDPSSPSYRDVYVVDMGNFRIDKYGPTGAFLGMIGGGVNKSAHQRGETAGEDVCPVRPQDVCGTGVQGKGHGAFWFRTEGDLIAVGPGGTVYVGDFDRVQEFSPLGVYEQQLSFPLPESDEPEKGGIIGVAVNSMGDVYVIRRGVGGVNEYTPSGDFLRTLDYQGVDEGVEGPTPTLALDAQGDVFIDEHPPLFTEYTPKPHRIVEYDAAGIEVARFDTGQRDGLHGLAFGDRAGKLYVVNSFGDVLSPLTGVRIVTPPPPHEPFAACGWCSWAGAAPPPG